MLITNLENHEYVFAVVRDRTEDNVKFSSDDKLVGQILYYLLVSLELLGNTIFLTFFEAEIVANYSLGKDILMVVVMAVVMVMVVVMIVIPILLIMIMVAIHGSF